MIIERIVKPIIKTDKTTTIAINKRYKIRILRFFNSYSQTGDNQR